jgi:hypothetical protein
MSISLKEDRANSRRQLVIKLLNRTGDRVLLSGLTIGFCCQDNLTFSIAGNGNRCNTHMG